MYNFIIGLLSNNRIDISSSAFSISKGRSQVVDYLPPLMESYRQIFIRNPTESLNWLVYIEPLTMSAGFSVIIFIALSPPLIAILFTDGKNIYFI